MQNHSQKAPIEGADRPLKSTFQDTVSIGILTYKRPEGLQRCLNSVQVRLAQPLPEPWTLAEILVIDNDPAQSARSLVAEIGDQLDDSLLPVRYISEGTPGIAAARSTALAETKSQVLVFIDDDEVAGDGWPHGLLNLMSETNAAMVGGPVLSEFTEPPPPWIVKGRFFDREDPAHGSQQEWLRSGNLAIDVHQVRAAGLDFDQRFSQGEDSAFSRLAKANGLDLRWSSNGEITEFVGPSRYEVMWRLRREYHGHRAWSRASLDMTDSATERIRIRLQTLAAAGGRIGAGTAHLLKAIPTRSKAEAVLGAIDLVGVVGKTVELVAYRRPH